MGVHQVVELGDQLDRRWGAARRAGRARQVEQLVARLVAEHDQRRAQLFGHGTQPGQAGPELGILDRGGTKCPQVAGKQISERALARRSPQPRIHRGMPGQAGLAPDRPGRYLNQRDQRPHALGEVARRAVRPPRGQRRAEFGEGQRLGLDQFPAVRREVGQLHVHQPLGLVGAERALKHRLGQPPQRQAVRGGHQVDGAAHQRDPDHLTIVDQRCQVTGLEAVDARPQAVVRRERVLRLQADQVLGRLQHEVWRATAIAGGQQQLPSEQGPVQVPGRQHVSSRHVSSRHWCAGSPRRRDGQVPARSASRRAGKAPRSRHRRTPAGSRARAGR